jgi:hypothetical protein
MSYRYTQGGFSKTSPGSIVRFRRRRWISDFGKLVKKIEVGKGERMELRIELTAAGQSTLR